MSSANCRAEAYRRSGSLWSAWSTISSRSPSRSRASPSGDVPRASAIASGDRPAGPGRTTARLGRSAHCSEMALPISSGSSDATR